MPISHCLYIAYFPVSFLCQSANRGVGRILTPGNVGSYQFTVPWAVAPGNGDPDCLTYIYYSNYNLERDVSSGLIGPLLICKPGSLDSYSGRQVCFSFKVIYKYLFLLKLVILV